MAIEQRLKAHVGQLIVWQRVHWFTDARTSTSIEERYWVLGVVAEVDAQGSSVSAVDMAGERTRYVADSPLRLLVSPERHPVDKRAAEAAIAIRPEGPRFCRIEAVREFVQAHLVKSDG